MSSRITKLLALLFALALVAAACGSGDDEETTDVTNEVDEEEQQQIEADRDAGEAEGQDTAAAGEGEPVRGGTLVYGIEADSANPWSHYATSCAISCRIVMRTVTDSLFITDTNADIQPYLAESMEPNDDFTQWTMTIREGISFHDGTPLDGAAVKYNLDTCRFSPLTGPAFLGLDDVQSDGQTVTLTYGAPEANPAAGLRTEVCGLMFSPTWMATLANNPLNNAPFVTEEEQAELDLSGDPAAPVGVGAFVYDSYTPGNGNSFIAVRNEDYWRGDGPNSITGEGLPYLDAVELVVAVDIQGRSNGLESGEFDIIHTANADEIAKFEGDAEFKTLQANDFGETNYILLNAAQGENPTLAFVRGVDSIDMDPGGLNAASPLTNLSCRKALAHAIDKDRLIAERYAGIVTAANGPFPPGSLGHLDDTGYPEFDLDAGAAEFETCKTESGQNPVTFSFNTTNDPFNVETNELISAMWTEAYGDEIAVTIAPIEQGQYIGLALAGAFQAQGWRNHGGVDPNEQWYWWSSATASPIDPGVPELALNFGRFQDPAMDAAMTTVRQNPDPAARQAAAEEVNRLFAENVWNLWTVWTLWGVIADPKVQNITDLPIPDSDLTTKPVIAGKHHLTQIWCLEGSCEG
ncbi:MAG: ABC transporter substrate-binding protein [Actinomycetota bacterium]